MSVFGNIMSKIFGHSAEAAPAATATSGAGTSQAGTQSASASSSASSPGSATGSGQNVDVAAVLKDMASRSGQQLNWRTSIVDLMKLLGLDSSFGNRQELAKELGYSGDMNDSASMNIWLHKQVMTKLEENGGKVPDDLKH